MSEKYYQVTHMFVVKLFCDECEAKGKEVEMRPGGLVFKKYQHVCPVCGARKLKDNPYPVAKQRVVELPPPPEELKDSGDVKEAILS